MASYKVDFKNLKSRVGVDDIAYALGYRLDKRAGVGKYIELVLGEPNHPQDRIIVSNPRNKGLQTFFRRNGSKGDVVTLIRENLNSFFVDGKDDWQKVAKVMAKFANMPEPQFREDVDYVKRFPTSVVFDPGRYELKPINPEKIPYLLQKRGFNESTVRTFAPFITYIRDRKNENFDGYNIGFPYSSADNEDVQGYEIRGSGGYKSKAAGTNSSSAAWVADLSGGNAHQVKHLYFFESAFDAMAFHQMNRARLKDDVALISIGGTFSDKQVTGVLERFPGAKPYDCFDNDVAGRIYGLRMLAIAEGIPLKIVRFEDGLRIENNGKFFDIDPSKMKSAYSALEKHFSLRHAMGQWVPPDSFKDWNDCLLGKAIEPQIEPTKFDRDRNLSEKRKSSTLKI